MQKDAIFVKNYTDELPIQEKQVWRYAGYFYGNKEPEENLHEVFDEVKKELEGCFTNRVCYGIFDSLPFEANSKDLEKNLEGAESVVMFAATIGHDLDKKILLYEKTSPVKALVAQAYGAERVEALCDKFCEDMRLEFENEGYTTNRRYSPGYGDLALEKQKDFFRILDINHKIGISLGESLLMRPSKSVTAIFGVIKK